MEKRAWWWDGGFWGRVSCRLRGDRGPSPGRWHLSRELKEVVIDSYRCLQENVLGKWSKWKGRACSVLDIFDSLVKKEAPYVHVTHCYPYWYILASSLSTEKVIKFMRNWTWLTGFSWGFNQEMEEHEHFNIYTKVFWSSIGQIWKHLVNHLQQDMSLFVLGVLFCDFLFGGALWRVRGFGGFFVCLFLRESKKAGQL